MTTEHVRYDDLPGAVVVGPNPPPGGRRRPTGTPFSVLRSLGVEDVVHVARRGDTGKFALKQHDGNWILLECGNRAHFDAVASRAPETFGAMFPAPIRLAMCRDRKGAPREGYGLLTEDGKDVVAYRLDTGAIVGGAGAWVDKGVVTHVNTDGKAGACMDLREARLVSADGRTVIEVDSDAGATEIEYVYQDADNYKAHDTVVLEGGLDVASLAELLSGLHGTEAWFVPGMVGLPDLQDRLPGVWDEARDTVMHGFVGAKASTAEPDTDLPDVRSFAAAVAAHDPSAEWTPPAAEAAGPPSF